MLKYAAILPHPPFVFDVLGGDHAKQLVTTRDAMRSIGEDLVSLHVDTVVLLSIHGERYENALSIAHHDPYTASLRSYGELGMDKDYKPDQKLIDTVQRHLRRNDFPVTLTTNDVLDHGASIPLLFLHEYIHAQRIIVITPPVADAKQMIAYGESLREAIEASNKRVALLCSASLSHRLSTVSPGGFHPEAEAFDRRIREALREGNTLPFRTTTQDQLEELGALDIDAIRLFVGILDDTRHHMEERSYEAPFGIGQLTMVAQLR